MIRDMKLLRAFVTGRQETQACGLDPIFEKARRRVEKMSAHDLLGWADAAGSGMAKGFDDYRAHGDVDSLYEIQEALLALQAVTEELIIREEGSNA